MAADLAQWLDDARKREQSMAFVDASKQKMRASERAAVLAREKRVEAEKALEGVAENAPVPEKLAGWALEDEATELEEQARTARTEAVQDLRAALSHAPDFVLAHGTCTASPRPAATGSTRRATAPATPASTSTGW
jgi:hypothetical protein